MDKKRNITSVNHLLEEILQIIDEEKGLENIERDLVLDKLRLAYDLLLQNKSVIVADKQPILNIQNEDLVKDEPHFVEMDEVIQQKEAQEENSPEDQLPEIEMVVDQPLIKQEEEIKEETVFENSKKLDLFGVVDKPKSTEKSKIESQESHDLFSDLAKTKTRDTIVDAISREVQKETLVEQFQHKKIIKLKEAIGINEKFFFLNELFEGDLTNYNQAIETLDEFSNSDEANNFIEKLAEQYHWEEHEQARIRFKDFFNRKFPED